MKRDYYILNNAKLRRKDNTVYYESEKGTRHLPINDIESIYCFGETEFNSRLINYFAENQVTIHLFNYYGYYTGSFYPREYLPSGFLLVKQVEKYSNPETRLRIAREFIESASFNILKNIKYYCKRKEGLEESIEMIEREREKIESVPDIQSLMGIEGRIREKYYNTFETITGGKFEFTKRIKRPPDNAMNALISFGNSLMYSTVLSQLYHTQLNPTISYLHEPGVRRFSLSLDISEIFKPIIVDRIIFKLINDGMIKESHFNTELNFCHLNESGRSIFLREYDERLSTTINHRKLERSVSYKTLVKLECYKLIKHLSDIESYEGFKMWW